MNDCEFKKEDFKFLSSEETKQINNLLEKVNKQKEERKAIELEHKNAIKELSYKKDTHLSYFFGNFQRIHKGREDTIVDLIGYYDERDLSNVALKDIKKMYEIMCEKLDKIKKKIDEDYAELQPICSQIDKLKKEMNE